MPTFQRLVYECCSRITLPVILASPVLFFFTIFCILDENFIASDQQAVVLLWVLVGVSLVYFLAMRKDVGPSPTIMFGIGTTQLAVLVAACMSMFAVVQEDSNTPRRQLSEGASVMNDVIMRGLR